MLTADASTRALRHFFGKNRIAQLDHLFKLLKTQSRMSVFRRLKAVGYLSSFTHAGRYYTLGEVPRFDEWGLWFHHGVGFSREGTLKATVIELVPHSEAGMTTKELRALLKLAPGNSLYNTLRELLVAAQLERGELVRRPLYLNIDPQRADEQLAQRQRRQQRERPPPAKLSIETVIEVLLETLQAGEVLVRAAVVSSRLRVRGVSVTTAQVEHVFDHYGLKPGKKTAAPGSRRWRK